MLNCNSYSLIKNKIKGHIARSFVGIEFAQVDHKEIKLEMEFSMKNELKIDSRDDLRTIGEIIDDAQVCMLTTHDEKDGLCSRPMQTLEVDRSGHLWFFTSTGSHIISEIRHNPKVNITYASGKNKFVSASGKAYEVYDRNRMRNYWTPMMKTWFPLGLESTDLVLLRIELLNVEYWDAPSSPVVRIVGFFQALSGSPTYSLSHHEKVNLQQ